MEVRIAPSPDNAAGIQTLEIENIEPVHPRVFISHVSSEKRWADTIARLLPKHFPGVEVCWIDRQELRIDEPWAEAVEKASVRSTAAVILLSPRYLSSDLAAEETSRLLDLAKRQHLAVFIIRVSDSLDTNAPGELLQYQVLASEPLDQIGEDPAAVEQFIENLARLLNPGEARGGRILDTKRDAVPERRDGLLDKLRQRAKKYPLDMLRLRSKTSRELLAKDLYNRLKDAQREGALERRDALLEELRELARTYSDDAAVREQLFMGLCNMEVRPGNTLVAVRDPKNLSYLRWALAETDTTKQDVVVMTTRVYHREHSFSGTATIDSGDLLEQYEQELFTSVVNLAEKVRQTCFAEACAQQ